MTSSGVVLFTKEFENPILQPRLVGPLLAAMVEFSTVTAGMRVSYIELSTVGVTIVVNEASKLLCAVFLDGDDGAEFGKLLATEILGAFQEEYDSDLVSAAGRNLRDYRGFDTNILNAIRRSVQPILNTLAQSSKGIIKALLVTEGSVGGSTSKVYSTSTDIDQLGVLANFHALRSHSTDIMAHCNDEVRMVTIESSGSGSGSGTGRNNARILMWSLHRCTLVVATKTSWRASVHQAQVDEAIGLLQKLSQLTEHLPV